MESQFLVTFCKICSKTLTFLPKTVFLARKKQVLQWRRSYDITPPKLKESNENHPKNDTKYSHLDDSIIPSAESLKDVVKQFF